MNNWDTPKPSVEELLRSCDSVLIAGCGGGGDIVQTVNVMNYAKTLGVKNVCLATIPVNWWGVFADGCEITDLDWYQPQERIHENCVRVLPESKLNGGMGAGRLTYEITLAGLYPDVPVYGVGLSNGLPGVLAGMEAIVEKHKCELFICADIGSDTFFTGEETQVCSPLIDAISVICASDLPVPGVYALNGYGGDAEMHIQHLDRNMGAVMREGGFLGASGITQKDVLDLEKVFSIMGNDDIQGWPLKAARGEMGIFYVKRWFSIERVPAAAVTFYFDPDVISRLNPVIEVVRNTETLQQAEDAIWEKCNLLSETRLALELDYPMPPQYPDKE